jgi:hypothetical protein
MFYSSTSESREKADSEQMAVRTAEKLLKVNYFVYNILPDLYSIQYRHVCNW